jgi:hypothetical protein
MLYLIHLSFLLIAKSSHAFFPLNTAITSYNKGTPLNRRFVVDEPNLFGENAFDNILDDETDSILLATDISASHPVTEERIDKLLNEALEASIKSVQDTFPSELLLDGSDLNVMEDESLKREIAQIFDRASNDLKAALNEIRTEQQEYAKESAIKSAAKSQLAIQNDLQRMEQAENSMEKMIQKVNFETTQVEKAVQDLKKAQESYDSDPIMKMLNGGIIKQSALAGAILFTLRSGTDTFLMLGGDSSHALPALIQGALAIVCAAYLFFA